MAPLTADSGDGGEARFRAERLERVFDLCFAAEFQTCLRGGAAEPLYQPAIEPGQSNILWYREDFFASALHEVAHWCIAGDNRRRQVDFGYWYAPDGRSAQQQAAFEAVETEPQALEWFFSLACDYRFALSADNLDVDNGQLPDDGAFQLRVVERAARWQRTGLPDRAARFYNALCREFGTTASINALSFCRESLQ